MQHILIVDDEPGIRSTLQKYLSNKNYNVSIAGSCEEAFKILEEEPVQVALVDLVMPKMDGIQLIHKMKQIQPSLVPIVITGFGTITSAIQAMKAGAFHYITKPFELDDISLIVNAALEHYNLKEENISLRKQLKTEYKFKNIVGKSEPMQAVFDLVDKVATTDSTILILGESGTGKELVARALHYNSRRAEKALVTVNCAAIPEGLLETELFGHVKGAYTGAISTAPGRFDNADQGTIFLDEIGDMSFKLQVKLLRVLQEQSFEPVGSAKTHNVDVRVIAATNHDLEKAVKEKRFREDLYYRLNVIPIHIPPLRERKDDIPLLANHFIEKFNREGECAIDGIDDTALAILMDYDWPGNVRELENTIERVAVLKRKGQITPTDLPQKIEAWQGTAQTNQKKVKKINLDENISFRELVADYETNLIKQALEKAGWNKNKAANLLGLNRTTLVEKLKKLKINK
ncbi:MAG: sigma-54 dependent transcriptional regulator [Pseudomonadota bacterium]